MVLGEWVFCSCFSRDFALLQFGYSYRPSFSLSKSCIDSGGRFVLAHFNRDVTFGLAGAYAPNRNPNRNEFLDYCTEEVDVAVPTVICGDCNCVFDRSLECRGSVASDTSRESTTALKKLFTECCVYDVWRSLHPTSSGSVSSRIDLIGCPLSWSHRVDACDIISCPNSNHSAVVLHCDVPAPLPRGPRRWKLNAQILGDSELLAFVQTFCHIGALVRAPLFPSKLGGIGARRSLRVFASGIVNRKLRLRMFHVFHCPT